MGGFPSRLSIMIRHAESHLDHVPPEVIDFCLQRFADRESFFMETFELPEHLPTLQYSLYGPAMGDSVITDDQVSYRHRGGRDWDSRIILAPKRPTRTCSIIAGTYKGHKCVIYTIFGGPITPREPADLSITDSAELERSKLFWSQHALAE